MRVIVARVRWRVDLLMNRRIPARNDLYTMEHECTELLLGTNWPASLQLQGFRTRRDPFQTSRAAGR